MLTKLPLLIDVHFHARDFNQSHKGTFKSESMAAVASGLGTVLCMPNTDPPIVSLNQLFQARRIAEANAYCDIGFNFGTRGDNLEEFERAYPFVSALKVYLNPTTGNLLIDDLKKVRQVFDAWPGKKPIMVHAEESDKVEMVIQYAEDFGKHVHICHVSRAVQIEAIRVGKRRGINVTAEACPHHLVLTEHYLEKLGSYALMKPPLATVGDRDSLWSALEDGTIDIIATDHAPHTKEEKESENPPFGVIGEQAFSLLWGVTHWDRSVDFLVEKMVTNPARIFGVNIDPQSYMLVDLEKDYTFEQSMVLSKAGCSPYVGRKVRGRIQQIILHGVEVVRDGEILAREGRVI